MPDIHDAIADSLVALYRALMEGRSRLGGKLRFLDAAAGVLTNERGKHVVAFNLSDRSAPGPPPEGLCSTATAAARTLLRPRSRRAADSWPSDSWPSLMASGGSATRVGQG